MTTKLLRAERDEKGGLRILTLDGKWIPCTEIIEIYSGTRGHLLTITICGSAIDFGGGTNS